MRLTTFATRMDAEICLEENKREIAEIRPLLKSFEWTFCVGLGVLLRGAATFERPQ